MTVSFNMIIESLGQCSLAFLPADESSDFTGLVAAGQQLHGFDDSQLLLLETDQDRCLEELERRPLLQAVCLLEESDKPLGALTVTGRCLGVRDKRGIAAVAADLSVLFQETLAWERCITELALDGADFNAILNASAPFIGCPMIVSGVGLQIVAYTSELRPREDVVLRAIENGSFDEEAVLHFQESGLSTQWELVDGITLIETTTNYRSYPLVFYVFRVNGNYYMHLVVHLEHCSLTPALKDKLQLMIDAIELGIQRNPPSESIFEESASAALTDCATGLVGVNRKVRKALAERGFTDGQAMLLMVVDYGLHSQERQIAAQRAMELARLSHPLVLALTESRVLVLAPAAQGADSSFANALEEHLARYDATCICSDSIQELRSLSFAYQQLCEGLKTGAAFGYPSACIHSFSSLFADYLMLSGLQSRDFVETCLQHSRAALITRSDEENGTDDAHVLQVYLECERKTGLAAERLFVHRNTLAYRIQRLQDTYGLDLDDPAVRRRLDAEFRLIRRLGC
ncbi:MAG: PucR family transcriptional regulator [Coriobacteriales bacterium]